MKKLLPFVVVLGCSAIAALPFVRPEWPDESAPSQGPVLSVDYTNRVAIVQKTWEWARGSTNLLEMTLPERERLVEYWLHHVLTNGVPPWAADGE